MLGRLISWMSGVLGSDRCPSEQQLAEYADQQAIGEDRHAIEQHLAHCDRCLRQVGFLLREQPDESLAVPEELISQAQALGTQNAKSTRFSPPWLTVGAAGVVAAIILVVWSFRTDRLAQNAGNPPSGTQPPIVAQSTAPAPLQSLQNSPTVRGADDGSEDRFLSPRAGETVKTQDMAFRWKATPADQFYELQVVSDDGDVVWETSTHSTSVSLPSTVRCVSGRTYYLRLRIHDSHGMATQSKTVGFVAQ